jgi:uncharacterized protein (TIGR00725 family)
MRYQIGIFGSGQKNEENDKRAYDVGRAIGRLGHALISGGLEGVMESSCIGAKEQGGLTIGILPGKQFTDGNDYLDIKILTNMQEGRNTLTGLSSHGCIIVGGSEGTLCEAKVVYDGRGPVVCIAGSGGTADYLLKNGFPSMAPKPLKIYSAPDGISAVELLIKLLDEQYK